MPFNILQSTGQPPQPRNIWPQMSKVLLMEKPQARSWSHLNFQGYTCQCVLAIKFLSLSTKHTFLSSLRCWSWVSENHIPALPTGSMSGSVKGKGCWKESARLGEGEGLASASWFAVPDYHLATGLHPVSPSSDWLQFPALLCTSIICLMMTLQRCQLSQSAPATGSVLWAPDSPMPVEQHPSLEIRVPALPTFFQMSRFWKLTILPFVPPALKMLTTSCCYFLSNFHVPFCLYVFPVLFGRFLSLYLLFNINNTHRLLGNWAIRCPWAP